ncbi:MAG: response regulator transcription factor, partial [Pseudomonadota bacterium]|nr:response regulator transcription factor [Pseudomonadota bacterium]
MDRRLIGQRILLIEDDLMLGESLHEVLLQHGALADWHKDGERLRHSLRQHAYDLLILDVGLPKLSGFELLKIIRNEQFDIPVLMLTARDQLSDRIRGLDLGADDYVLKPFDLGELLARLCALIRRGQGRAQPKLSLGALSLDPVSHRVEYQQQGLHLSKQEFRLLHVLLEHAGQVMTRDRLEQVLLSDGIEIESNSLEVHIHHLR